jgi:type III restriction enzyme
LIAITNKHLLTESNEAELPQSDEDLIEAHGATPEPHQVVAEVLPLRPGRDNGNSLEVLDKRYARGNVLEFLAQLPELMVFNDEAHHIHEFKREGESTEVKWQKSLTRIAQTKGRSFVQVDFSATPYNDIGTGRNKRKLFFPHIITDFDLKSAMRMGLVKSLVLDRSKDLAALPLDFKAERDESGHAVLSEGQRVMLRAGLTKLHKLEKDFAKLDPHRHPKMLVMCEDTSVTPLVAQFLQDEGLLENDVMTIDSGKKTELGEKDWIPVRERLFSLDKHAKPKVVVNVLMLREGFDVNNICIIVPLRTSQAQILLEQTIGRGLRLMWREPEFSDIKQDNRDRIHKGQEPESLLDVLTIVEHPAFQSFYDELRKEGLVGETGEAHHPGSSNGDLLQVPLRDNYELFDFGIPFILRESEEMHHHVNLDVATLTAFTTLSMHQLKDMLGKGDTFISQDLQSSVLFGDYRVNGAVMNVSGYNDYLNRLTRRISQALKDPLPSNNKVATHLSKPYMQINTAELTGWIDDFIWTQLFAQTFNPLEDENWRLLLLQPVIDHMTTVFALALIEAEDKKSYGNTEVHFRFLSEMKHLTVRKSASVEVS